MSSNLITKIKKAELIGRGGAGFPTALKWQSVKKAKGDQKYVICNASERELGVFKDFFILKNYPEEVFEGMRLAMEYIGTKDAVINLNADYYKKLQKKIDSLVRRYRRKGFHIKIYKEPPSYIGGEETALLEGIEGNLVMPRLKPPYPSDVGLYGCPTIINNVETFYNVALVDSGEFDNARFCCVTVDGKKKGVYRLSDSLSVKKVLEQSDNLPKYNFFVQVGGSASGLVVNREQIAQQKIIGAGAIEVYRATTKPRELLKKWFDFYAVESCGKCAPCRMGTYNLALLIKDNRIVPWKKILEIVDAMEQISFCGLGKSIATPVKSYRKNVLKK